MAAQTRQAVAQQREALTNKVETRVDQKINLNNQSIIQYHRIILQGLPLAGNPTLLVDEHRTAIAALVDKTRRYEIRIKSITGYASEPGANDYNLQLSQRRADAVFDHLRSVVDNSADFSDNSFYANIRINARGEAGLSLETEDGSDHPLNRRVEISYVLKYTFPQAPGANAPRSRFWKIDFAMAVNYDLGQIGTGKLIMLQDPDHNTGGDIEKNMTFESLGISIGLFSVLKKLKLAKRIPGVKRLLKAIEEGMPVGPYEKTAKLLTDVGFSADVTSQGGEFETSEALSFAEMQQFNFATIAGGLRFIGNAQGSLVMLHSPYFFGYTVIYGSGINIAVPDASLEFIPAGSVKVSI